MEFENNNINSNYFLSEKEFREKKYEETFAENNSLSTENFTSQTEQENDKKELIVDSNKIKSLFKVYCRDKIKFNIISKSTIKLDNNKFISCNDNSVSISNTFLMFANKTFPEVIHCNFSQNGIEFSFVLEKLNKNDNNKIIECSFPKEIKILKRRSNVRIKIAKDDFVPISLFLKDKNIELLGHLIDISNIGLGISFLQSTIDSDLMSYLTSIIKTEQCIHCPIIIVIAGNYFNISISIKHIRENNKMIDMGSEFIFNDESKIEIIKSFLENKKNDEIIDNKKNKTNNLILLSKNDLF